MVLLGIVAAGVAYQSRPAAAQEKAPVGAVTKWEYRLVMGDNEAVVEKKLNQLGEEGFEIAFVANSTLPGHGNQSPYVRVYYTLKRAKK